ncbi:WXG100 family type VII secretion target [Streptomyces odontomachi]|uniref:WXG100 family type VII secretion target n=1 Tax=Streptomyces odontomachi TaxID=2944940 RepID=UPI00210C458B|nr:WXG100 family type VII secretion target [Streptomyces sp. ODS25]
MGKGNGKNLNVSQHQLTKLADDLGRMERDLHKKIRHLDQLVEAAEVGWKSPAATVYRELQRSVNRDALRIREMLLAIQQAVRLGRDGFSAQDLEIMLRIKRLEATPEGEREILALADEAPAPPQDPRSRLDAY